MKQSKDGRVSFNSAWKELLTLGYLFKCKIPNYNNTGRYGYEYDISDEPTYITD